jgi:hypothetical protein
MDVFYYYPQANPTKPMLKCGKVSKLVVVVVSGTHLIARKEVSKLSRKCANRSKLLFSFVLSLLSTVFSTVFSTAFVEMVGSV